jgi:hypothetical protein
MKYADPAPTVKDAIAGNFVRVTIERTDPGGTICNDLARMFALGLVAWDGRPVSCAGLPKLPNRPVEIGRAIGYGEPDHW